MFSNRVRGNRAPGLLGLVAVALLSLLEPGLAQARTVTTRLSLSPGKLSGLSMEGFGRSFTPGQPALPARSVSVALHPAADLSTLKLQLSSGPSDNLAGRRTLMPNPPLQVLAGGRTFLEWGRAGRTVTGGRDPAAYGARLFPPQVVTRQRITNRRGLLVLRLSYTPLRYRHSTRELLLDRHTEVTLSYRVRDAGRSLAHDPQLMPHLQPLANVTQAHAWYGVKPGERLDTTKKIGYAILIPDALATRSKQLAKFILHKQALGMSVRWVRDADLAAISVGPKAGDAERMRFWLQQNYKKLNLKYVLIIGNPDPARKGVPMKLTYPYADNKSYPTITPSDLYYSDLTGNWDLDGDGKVAEFYDDAGTGGIDLTPEVYVGRIPIYDNNATALDHILKKNMAYAREQGDKAWRKRVLQPAAMLFYENQYGQKHYRIDGATMANAIWEKCIKPRKLTSTTMYEEDGVDPSKLKGDIPLTRDNLIKEWRKGYGLVTWFGHGSADGVFRTIWKTDKDKDKIPDYGEISSPAFFSYDDVLKLDDTRPSVVFHGSCSNGTPEKAYNIGYGLLLHGAVATVSSTRIAVVLLGSSFAAGKSNIFGVEMDFTDAVLGGKAFGPALAEAKSKLADVGMLTWFTHMQITLYGDPALSLTACTKYTDCDDGDKCNGSETCLAGQCVAGKAKTCKTLDPCSEATCESKTGTCKTTLRPAGEACDDGKFCTIGETCNESGKCVGASRCEVKDNPCALASCDEKLKTCQVQTVETEGQSCREDTDREGVCAAGICRPASPSGCGLGHTGPRVRGLLVLLPLMALLLCSLRRRHQGGGRP